MAPEQPNPYPVRLSIDYPESSRRLTAFFRLFLAVPILILLFLITGAPPSDEVTDVDWDLPEAASDLLWTPAIWMFTAPLVAGGLVWIPAILMILFRRKYPRWWFDWNLEMTRFATRIYTYLILLRDDYPSTDEPQGVNLDIPYPEVETQLNRFLALIKWFLAIPHYIALAVLWSLAVAVTVIAWFVILIVGRYPRELFLFVEGVLRWSLRVLAYAFLLTTDRYPPFRFGE